jgi:serum/glucocorticoid-regulated kinase 2
MYLTSFDCFVLFFSSPEYLAPEVLQGQGHGFPCDWWSLGTLLYEMLTGLPPFYNQNLHVMYEKIVRAKVQYPSYLSAEARSLIQALLERNPKLRLGYEQDGAEIRAHPFFAPVDWDKLQKKEVQPPFVPTVTEGKLDTGNVDEEFKREMPQDTPVVESTLRSKVNFPGFTYQAPESVLNDSVLNQK